MLNVEFSPGVFCLESYTGKALNDRTSTLKGGKEVQYKKIQEFPPAGFQAVLTADQIGQFVHDNLPSDCIETIVMSENAGNYYAMFRSTYDFNRIIVLVFHQDKRLFRDWTKPQNTQTPIDIISSWRKHTAMLPKGRIKVKDAKGQDATVEALHILQTTD